MPLLAAPTVEDGIARCRLVLSVATLIALYLDPSQPLITQWRPFDSGAFHVDPVVFAILAAYFCLSLGILMLRREVLQQSRVTTICIWCDVACAAILGVFTEGQTAASGGLFLFAVTEAASTTGLRSALFVNVASAVTRVATLAALNHGASSVYFMRPFYMFIIGCAISYIFQQRLNLESGIRELAAALERERVARDLHDDHAQVLGGIAMRLETCGELLGRGRQAEAVQDLAQLGKSVYQEYDALRVYTRSLLGIDSSETKPGKVPPTRFTVHVQLEGSGILVDQVLQILRGGIRNVMRHASAATAAINTETVDHEVRIRIDDDGVGFQMPQERPWSITSRVNELGGAISLVEDHRAGAHLAITLPLR